MAKLPGHANFRGMNSGKAKIMSALVRKTGVKLNADAPAPESRGEARARRMLAGFGPGTDDRSSRDRLSGAALTMLLVLYPALASVVVAIAAFLLCGSSGTA